MLNIKNPKKKISLAVAILCLVGFAIGGTIYYQRNKTRGTENTQIMPATEQEKKETEEYKDTLAKDTENHQNQNNPTSNLTVVITSANQNEIYSYVQGVLEDGGKCIANFYKEWPKFSKDFKRLYERQYNSVRAVLVDSI
jgi:uncharacterized protein HemX